MNDKPLTETEREELRLIIGTVPDSVARSRAWCEANDAQITIEAGRFHARRGSDTLATALDLETLLDKLERMEP